ncbi:MarR family transcriptional regulator [Halopiger djelfimassiliensis]|uniref:MarR family transcriptional regulator n=1 Tax=Halopiger djelfimassiliensis TaxID=1293047 RepID=UPI000677F3EC|nr:MarR family transcriptional regulator [Halopiger djelfimassiliensis]
MDTDGQARTAVSIPSDIESAQAKLVYLYLSIRQGASADDICTALELSKGTVLSIAGTLRERGHLERTDTGFALA